MTRIRPQKFGALVSRDSVSIQLMDEAVTVDVALPWQHAKGLLMYLYAILAAHEDTHGVIVMPEGTPLAGSTPRVAERIARLRHELDQGGKSAAVGSIH